jgi:hypothetical protein
MDFKGEGSIMALNIYYDGDCFFCKNFVRKLELEEMYGQVNLYSLRDPAVKNKVKNLGFNLNNGFLIEYNNQWFWGDDAYDLVRNGKKKRGKLSFLNLISKIPYKFLVFGRYLTLIVQGIGLINITENDDENSMFIRSVRLSFLFLLVVFLLTIFFASSNILICSFLAIFLLYLIFLSYTKLNLVTKIKYYFENQTYLFWIIYSIAIICILNAIPITSLSRIAFFFLVLPLTFYFYGRYKSESDKKNNKSGIILVCLTIFCSFPGLYIAPFFGGISGWYVEQDTSKNFYGYSHVLTNLNDEKVVLNHALLEPITLNNRLYTAWRLSGRDRFDYINFLFKNYKRLYPILESGNLSHQRILGKLAYPCHNLCDYDGSIYLNFPPQNIKSISLVKFEFNWKGDLVKQEDKIVIPISLE